MSSTTLFEVPADLVSVANWLFTDPTTGASAFPYLNQLVGQLAGAELKGYEPIQVDFTGSGGRGSTYNIRRYDPNIRAAQALYAGDLAVLPFLSWWGGEDPRADLIAAAEPYGAAYFPDLDSLGFSSQLGGLVASAAMRHRLGEIGVADADIDSIINTLLPTDSRPLLSFGAPSLSGLATGGYQYFYDDNSGDDTIRTYTGVAKDDPLRPLADLILNSISAPSQTYSGVGNTFIYPYPDDPYRALGSNVPTTTNYWLPAQTDFNADVTNAQLRTALIDSGITVPSLNPIGTTTTGGTVATGDNSGVQPTPLNYFAPFLALMAGGYPGLDDSGNPTWTSLTPAQWNEKYGGLGLFGPDQLQAFQDYLEPRPLNDAEVSARDMLSGDKAQQLLDQALGNLNSTVLPGLQRLAETGFRTPTPDLYSADQLGLAEQLARTGNRAGLEDAASTYMNREVAPGLAARYGAQLGSSGSDFGGELLNQARLFSADIADRVSQNQIAGQGLWGDMTSTQGLLDSQLSEAAASRRAQGLPLYGSWSQYASQLPVEFAKDISNIGGTWRASDEANSASRRAMDLFGFLLSGATPNNLGYVAQGQLPSASTQLAQGLIPQTGTFAQAALGGLGGSLLSGLGSTLGSNLFSGGGFDSNGNFGILGDLGGLLGGLGSSILSGVGSLFGGGSDNSQVIGSSQSNWWNDGSDGWWNW